MRRVIVGLFGTEFADKLPYPRGFSAEEWARECVEMAQRQRCLDGVLEHLFSIAQAKNQQLIEAVEENLVLHQELIRDAEEKLQFLRSEEARLRDHRRQILGSIGEVSDED